MKKWLRKAIIKCLEFLKVCLRQFKIFGLASFKFIRKHYIKIGFFTIAFVFFFNAILMTLHFINRDYGYRILDQLYVETIMPDQDLTGKMSTGIARIEKVDYELIAINDSIVFCCDYGLDENWVQRVVNIDKENKLLEVTYDGVVTTIASEEQVYGLYLNEANFFGTLYYTSTFLRGYILLMVSQLLFLYIYHYAFIQKRLIKEEKISIKESEKQNEKS